jgi:4-hydroxybenzoate polyprenyltransferase/predicted HAD superfamily phosphohydrolase YqeG
MPKQISFADWNIGDIKHTALFLDVDGTLVADRTKNIPEDVFTKIRSLAQHNAVYMCSNGSYEHAKEIADRTGTKAIPCRKPVSGEMKTLAKEHAKTIVVGDKYLTDGLLARALHADFIKTPHIRAATDSPFTKLVYLVDDIAWNIRPYATLMRPWHWVKNILVFAPLFFASGLLHADTVARVALAFVAFCLSASMAYVLNDLHDEERDRQHPIKCRRPIAAGDVTRAQAFALLFALVILEALVLWQIPQIAIAILAYLVLNQVYSSWIKHIAVADILCVAVFYILRIVVGGLAAPAPLSPWIILCTFFGALFVIIGKRRAEYRLETRRAVLEQYSQGTLDMMLGVSVTLTVISYAIWSVLGHASTALVYSTLFVLFAILRTVNRMYGAPEQAESPETLVFRDPWIVGAFLCWAAFVFIIFYTKLI